MNYVGLNYWTYSSAKTRKCELRNVCNEYCIVNRMTAQCVFLRKKFVVSSENMNQWNREQVIRKIYNDFNSPITEVDCGEKCSPHNEYGIPFCCDIKKVIPSAYREEWDFLTEQTDLWQIYVPENEEIRKDLEQNLPECQVGIVCKGYNYCQRQYRSIACRSFPFYPYIDDEGNFIGLAYFWKYEDICWVISNLDLVETRYIDEFVQAYERIFDIYKDEWENYRYYSMIMRKEFGKMHREIIVLHRNHEIVKIYPSHSTLSIISKKDLKKFGVFKLIDEMPFPDELEE